MTKTATAEATIGAPVERVWEALTDPHIIERYMFGARVVTDWQPGSPITWKGEYQGTSYEDKGVVLDVDRPQRLELTHFSPMSGLPDEPENYHRLTYLLEETEGRTTLHLSQDGAATDEEAEESARNWQEMLNGLKAIVEHRATQAS